MSSVQARISAKTVWAIEPIGELFDEHGDPKDDRTTSDLKIDGLAHLTYERKLPEDYEREEDELLGYDDLSTGGSEIRLLRVLPAGNEEDIVHCMLVKETEASGLKYRALSYEWGSRDDLRSIVIGPNQIRIRIRKNLESALKRTVYDEF